MRVSVIGTGYVGLVSGTCFSEMGNDVVCVDIDEAKVAKLTDGELTIFEPGLELYFERNLREDRLHFTTELAPAVEHADIIFLALPTPPGEDGSADLRYVLGVAHDIGELLAANPDWGYKVIVDKSTVPVGTADLVTAAISEAGVAEGERFDVVSNPEFLREGVAVDDFMKPERVVIGTSSEKAADLMTQLYEPFVRSGNPIIVMDEKSAEMTKYAANALLATKITFMNEIANVCDRVGADVDKVRRGIGTDSRIGPKFLYAGIGFGGSCFPKDVQALVRTAQQNDYPFEILQAVLNVNEEQRTILMPRIEAELGDLNGKKIAMWGLAFKPNTDDVREASSHAMIRALTAAGADVVAYDPEAIETTRPVLGEGPLGQGSIHYTTDSYGALIGADALVICTEWPEFRRPDFERVRTLLKEPILFDGRNLYDHDRMATAGFRYFSIGRPYVAPSVPAIVSTNGQA
ncbi:MAG: UDP-glucose/GDP-mannose dehydrogenase family protein [Bacteroidota bacterium]